MRSTLGIISARTSHLLFISSSEFCLIPKYLLFVLGLLVYRCDFVLHQSMFFTCQCPFATGQERLYLILEHNSIIDIASMLTHFSRCVTILIISLVLVFWKYRYLLRESACTSYLYRDYLCLYEAKKMNQDTMEANAVLSSSIIEDINGSKRP